MRNTPIQYCKTQSFSTLKHFHTCNGSGQTLGLGVAALTTVVNSRCYDVFSSSGKADFAQPHMATGVPETTTILQSPKRLCFSQKPKKTSVISNISDFWWSNLFLADTAHTCTYTIQQYINITITFIGKRHFMPEQFLRPFHNGDREYMASIEGFPTVDCLRSLPSTELLSRFLSCRWRQEDLPQTAEPRWSMWASRRATVSMLTRSEIPDTKQMTRLIHIRPVLWAISCEEHSSKTRKQNAWLVVCTEMHEGFDTFAVEKYNKNLSSIYTNRCTKIYFKTFNRTLIFFYISDPNRFRCALPQHQGCYPDTLHATCPNVLKLSFTVIFSSVPALQS